MPSGAMFDVKPVDESGALDVEKINSIKPVVDLASFRPKKSFGRKPIAVHTEQESLPTAGLEDIPLPDVIELPSKQNIKEEFEQLLNRDIDLGIELAKIGTTSKSEFPAKPRYRVIQSSSSVVEANRFAPIVSAIQTSARAIYYPAYTEEPEAEPTLVDAPASSMSELIQLTPSVQQNVTEFFYQHPVKLITKKISPQPIYKSKTRRISNKYILIAVGIFIALGLVIKYGFHVKNEIVQQSTSAVSNLESAQADLKTLDFKNASQDFFSAYSSFSKAGESMNVFGATITDFISALPGASSLKSAKNLVKVGELLSAAGTSMTTALNAVSRTGALADPTNPDIPIGLIIGALKKALMVSKQQVAEAGSLLADIDSSIIPADKQVTFNDFKSKFPDIETAVSMGADYSRFFENLVMANGYKRYLVMFQNSSELRPTGGFPGTYGVISFKDGKLDNLFVDDVYNLDGQLKEHIVPPIQLQHITPTWGMRDANWYVDFPKSAKNIEFFYKKEAGQNIDGVIVVNPEMIAKILGIVGPIEMPQYKLTLTAENILTTIQDQVEYGPNRAQPKQIIKDFAPLLLSKIYTAGSDKWLEIFSTLVLSINEHNVLMNFNDLSLQSFVVDNGFSGQVHQGDKDYLMATITNVKGSKTDAVTDTSMSVDTSFSEDSAVHTVTISRQHNGGNMKYGFYNKQNPAYVRVLVPEDAEFISIVGNDKPNFKPLVDYSSSKFVRDDNLVKFESSSVVDTSNRVTTYIEVGKKEFGFWLITDAGKSKTVTLRYSVPKALAGNKYELYIQKQPSLKVKDFSFSMQKSESLIPEASYPLLTAKDNAYTYLGKLDNDLIVKVDFK